MAVDTCDAHYRADAADCLCAAVSRGGPLCDGKVAVKARFFKHVCHVTGLQAVSTGIPLHQAQVAVAGYCRRVVDEVGRRPRDVGHRRLPCHARSPVEKCDGPLYTLVKNLFKVRWYSYSYR